MSISKCFKIHSSSNVECLQYSFEAHSNTLQHSSSLSGNPALFTMGSGYSANSAPTPLCSSWVCSWGYGALCWGCYLHRNMPVGHAACTSHKGLPSYKNSSGLFHTLSSWEALINCPLCPPNNFVTIKISLPRHRNYTV